MAIISFWSEQNKSSAQTLSATAIATKMAIDHNMKILLVDVTFQDDTLERCFWEISSPKKLSKLQPQKYVDISSGAEGLVSAVASNKTTPEIITNFTRVVFKNRLDVLCGLKTKVMEEFNRSLSYYKDLLVTADKYYDLIVVDLDKTLNNEYILEVLNVSHLIMYTLPQNLRLIDNFLIKSQTDSTIKNWNLYPILTNVDQFSKYNSKNVTRYLREKKEIPYILNNSNFMESACEGKVANFFLKTRLSASSQDKNSQFIKSVEDACEKINYKLQELKYKI